MPETPEEKQKAAEDKAAAGQVGVGGETPPTFETWFGAQDEKIKGLIAEHTKGLKSALDAERGIHSDLEKQLRDAAAKAEAGSELKAQLEAAAQLAETATAQVEFQQAAHAAGVTNLRLAWLAVQADENLRDRRGNVNFEALKTQMPELFSGAAKPPPGNAGAGTGGQQKTGSTMNDFILAGTGRR